VRISFWMYLGTNALYPSPIVFRKYNIQSTIGPHFYTMQTYETQRLRGRRWWLFEVYGFALLLPQDTECSLRLRGVKVRCLLLYAYPAYIARWLTLYKRALLSSFHLSSFIFSSFHFLIFSFFSSFFLTVSNKNATFLPSQRLKPNVQRLKSKV
jgi:hypothetical protein